MLTCTLATPEPVSVAVPVMLPPQVASEPVLNVVPELLYSWPETGAVTVTVGALLSTVNVLVLLVPVLLAQSDCVACTV